MIYKRDLQLGVFTALSAIAMFSIMNALIKGIEVDYPPVQVAFFRFFISMFLGFGFYLCEKNRPRLFISSKITFKHALRGVVSVLSITALCTAFRMLPFAEATAINFSSILFITALSVPLLHQQVDKSRWIAVFTGFIGILVIAQPGGDLFGMGALYALFYAITDAYVIVSGRLRSQEHSPGAAMAVFCLCATLVSGIMTFFYWKTPTPNDAILFLLLGLCGGTGFLLQTIAYNLAPASAVAPMAYSAMLWGIGLGFFFWNEIPNMSLVLGGVLIIGSGYYIIRKEVQGKGIV